LAFHPGQRRSGSTSAATAGSVLQPDEWKVIMKTHHILVTASVAVLAWGTSPLTMAQTPTGKTREQVRAELMEAVRTGNIPCNDDSGRLMREVYPSNYPQTPAAEAKTREQVQAELQEAIRTGNIMCNNDSGMLERQVNPSRYPAAPAAAGKTRAQVQQELREAIRTGDMPANDESGRKLNEVYPGLYPRK